MEVFCNDHTEVVVEFHLTFSEGLRHILICTIVYGQLGVAKASEQVEPIPFTLHCTMSDQKASLEAAQLLFQAFLAKKGITGHGARRGTEQATPLPSRKQLHTLRALPSAPLLAASLHRQIYA